MAVPSSGPLPINAIVNEFGGTIPHSLSEYYRGGPLVPNTPANTSIPTAGTIPMQGFYGTQNRVSINVPIGSPRTNYNAYSSRTPSYIAGASDITYTINPGVTIGASSRTANAFAVPSAFNPGDTITVVNNGAIRAGGGPGGAGGPGAPISGVPGGNGAPGGTALLLQRPTSVRNNGTLAGGGGGGGGGGGAEVEREISSPTSRSGSGGGGGAGVSAGAGGGAGSPINPAGQPGTVTGGGSAGSAFPGHRGGNGGGAGANGAPGDNVPRGGTGGTRGFYINGNSFATWLATGTRLGRST